MFFNTFFNTIIIIIIIIIIANSDDLDNYERNTQETIEITTLLQEGINECTPEQENPGIPINVPTEDEQFYVDIRNIAQPTFNLLKE